MTSSFAIIAASFLAGSIPFGLIIGMTVYGVDLRQHGSGNIGAANAMRTIGKAGAAMVLLLDALKGYAPVAWVNHATAEGLRFSLLPLPLTMIVAMAAVLGHCFTPWLGFRGGKGIATSLGVALGLSWLAGTLGILSYAVIARLTRISSIGSISAVAVGAVVLTWQFGTWGACYGIFSLALILYTHRDNLARLRAGRELSLRTSPEGGTSEVPSGE